MVPGADVMAEPGEFSLDAAVPPARVLPRQLDDRFAKIGIDWWVSWSVGAGPCACDEAAVPCRQRGGCDDAVAAESAGEHPGQGGQDRPVGP
jgi:hypothetical protein